AACRAAVSAGRRALVIVPDATALDRLAAALAPLFDAERIARLSNDEGLSERAGAHLRARAGLADVVIGTRSAAFAPVPELGLLACFDDGDSNLTERQAPYAHARDVLLLRSARQEVPLLLSGYAVSAEAQRLVDTGWAVPLSPDREDLRRTSPLVVATSDSYQRARDPLAALARIPQRAHQAARRALEHGPVLVQVARTGYAPTLACQRCRTPARCPHCHGPLGLTRDSRSHAECRWCGRAAADWACPSCGNRTWRLSTVGALRTAEELGRAFPRVPVISSSGEHVRAQVPDRPPSSWPPRGPSRACPAGTGRPCCWTGTGCCSGTRCAAPRTCCAGGPTPARWCAPGRRAGRSWSPRSSPRCWRHWCAGIPPDGPGGSWPSGGSWACPRRCARRRSPGPARASRPSSAPWTRPPSGRPRPCA
ncbi:helicase PriA, partial [Rothia kristinae]|nr:helicase PriA [Rothia kristinae]